MPGKLASCGIGLESARSRHILDLLVGFATGIKLALDDLNAIEMRPNRTFSAATKKILWANCQISAIWRGGSILL
ncbi:MAG: hypothetical protein GDA43_20230 [Hormoscilla sp. SP5CHS1]|nr:hypothetical protein [Hormoscilla sp. SP12CHS1]MBC6455236.1 hypothetical protein [Hormoscilla sp. SP5CHS1]MBC6475390.1 hypothetical protein [Hormoscilla sp. GM102CHS1]